MISRISGSASLRDISLGLHTDTPRKSLRSSPSAPDHDFCIRTNRASRSRSDSLPLVARALHAMRLPICSAPTSLHKLHPHRVPLQIEAAPSGRVAPQSLRHTARWCLSRSGLSCFLLRFAAGITPALRYFVPPRHDVCLRTHRARAPLSDSLRSALRFVFRSPWTRTPTSPAPTTCSTPSFASMFGGGIRNRDSVPPSRNRLLALSFRATHSRSDSLPMVAPSAPKPP